jgi:hypothetical protein
MIGWKEGWAVSGGIESLSSIVWSDLPLRPSFWGTNKSKKH